MKKADRTKAHIEQYVQFFTEYVHDSPTQKEVSENTGIAYRTVQRYYKAGKYHQFNQIGSNRLQGDSYAADKFSDIMFDFWREVDSAPPIIKVKFEDIFIDWKKYREQCEFTGIKEDNKWILDYWIKNKMQRPTKSVYSIGVLQIQNSVAEGNTYQWEHTLRLYKDDTLIRAVPTSREFFDTLSANNNLWSTKINVGKYNVRQGYWEPNRVHLSYLGECKMREPSQEKEVERLVEVQKVLEQNNSPFIDADFNDTPNLIDALLGDDDDSVFSF